MEEKYIQMIVEATQSAKSAHHRIDKVEEDVSEIKELTVAVKEIAMETKANREDVNKMNERLENIEQKPAKNWEKVTSVIITRNCNSDSGLFFSKIRAMKGGRNMEKLIQKLTSLLNVKTIVTILLTVVFCILAVKQVINGEQFLVIFTTVIAFYFGTQHEKGNKEE